MIEKLHLFITVFVIIFILYFAIIPVTVVCNTEKMYLLNFEVIRIKNLYYVGAKAYPTNQCTIARHWFLKYPETLSK